MKTIFILLFLQSFFVYRETFGLEIGSIIKPCKYNDPDLNECVKAAAHKLIPLVSKGIPQWNVPTVDPLTTPERTFTQKTHGNDLTIVYKDIVQTGFSAIEIESAAFEYLKQQLNWNKMGICTDYAEADDNSYRLKWEVLGSFLVRSISPPICMGRSVKIGRKKSEVWNGLDLDHGVMNFKLKYPYLTFTADYTASGQFLGFEVSGSGKANVSVWNAYSSFILKYHVISDHIREDSIIIGFSFDKIYLDYSNLMINNDKELSETAPQFINDNSKEIIEGFKPELEQFYAEISRNFLQVLFDVVPYSRLFPKD